MASLWASRKSLLFWWGLRISHGVVNSPSLKQLVVEVPGLEEVLIQVEVLKQVVVLKQVEVPEQEEVPGWGL